MSARGTREETLLLGVDHPDYGCYALRVQREGATACTLSAGSDPRSVSRTFKARDDVPNEDALLVVDEGALTMMAVCDAHFGHEASHVLLERLRDIARPLPRNPLALLEAVRESNDESPEADYRSETTLLVGIWDRESRAGFGTSFGDSTLMVLGPNELARPANRKTAAFVSPRVPESLDPRRAHEFTFRARTGELLVAFTDGVDECHYGSPGTSIRPPHLRDTLMRSGADPQRFVRDLTELAMAGVDGNPGGQDNIALIASLA